MSDKKERLDKVLGNLGIGTRKEVKEIIRAERIRINGIVNKAPETKVSLSDEIVLDEEVLERREFYYLMINKPTGCITSTDDPREKTVMEYLSPRLQNMNLFPIGRLDKDTEGLLIITNDGQLTHKLTSPKHHVWKTYYAKIQGNLSEADVQSFQNGVTIDDGYKCLPGRLKIVESGNISSAIIEIREGKYRQIRRMFVALGKEVIYLKRTRMGDLELDENLPLGEYRYLSDSEVEQLKPDKRV